MIVEFQSLDSPELSLVIPFDHKANPRNYKGEPLIRRNVNFKNFFKKLDSEDEKESELIDVLINHPENIANGGASFKKVEVDLGATLAVNEGKTFAAMPEHGMLKEYEERIRYLSNLKATMPPNTKLKAVRVMQEIFENFSVAGISKVTKDTKPKIVYARSLDLLETLEERGIWKDGNTEGKEHSGQSSEEDQG